MDDQLSAFGSEFGLPPPELQGPAPPDVPPGGPTPEVGFALSVGWVLATDMPNVAVEIDAAEAERRRCIAHQIKCPVLAM